MCHSPPSLYNPLAPAGAQYKALTTEDTQGTGCRYCRYVVRSHCNKTSMQNVGACVLHTNLPVASAGTSTQPDAGCRSNCATDRSPHLAVNPAEAAAPQPFVHTLVLQSCTIVSKQLCCVLRIKAAPLSVPGWLQHTLCTLGATHPAPTGSSSDSCRVAVDLPPYSESENTFQSAMSAGLLNWKSVCWAWGNGLCTATTSQTREIVSPFL
jgi:hypothetical protein